MKKVCKDCVVWLLSGCRTDFCLPEREPLMEKARQSAEQGGHTLTEFVKLKGRPIWQARCARCGWLAAINLDPSPNEACIYGEAVVVSCRETDAEKGRTAAEAEE
jgi:hypothetical protein